MASPEHVKWNLEGPERWNKRHLANCNTTGALGAAASPGAGWLRRLGTAAVCILLAAVLVACAAASEDPAGDERLLALETNVQTLEASIAALADENAALKSENALLRERLDSLDAQLQELEEIASEVDSYLAAMEQWDKGKDEQADLSDDAILEATAKLAEASGGAVYYIDHPARKDRTVLIAPQEFVNGKTPLIVSLHGFGGNAADHAAYVPLHERVNTHGFALLLPNGIRNAEGDRFWNPTDECCDGGKSGADDAAYLTELVAGAKIIKNFGRVYVFGYSNGGFMAYHLACKGLPGLRAVASLAGTSYVDDSRCDGAQPVSVLHVHGTADDVILFEGDRSAREDDEPAFYAGAREMVTRWSRRAGCDWPDNPQPYAALDLDQYVPGAETHAFRLEAGCTEGITIELWQGEGSGHGPGYGDAFTDALVTWLLSQE